MSVSLLSPSDMGHGSVWWWTLGQDLGLEVTLAEASFLCRYLHGIAQPL